MTAHSHDLPTGADLLPTRETLLSRLRDWDDQESWREFFQIYWKFIYGVARKAGLSEAEAGDVVSETIKYVCHKMPGFKYDRKKGSFKGWLTMLTKWRINDQFRRREGELAMFVPPQPDDPDPFLNIADPGPVPSDVVDEEWERNLLEAAIQRVKEQVKPKQFQMFDLYFLKEWPIRQVTTTLGVNIGQVYMAKHRITALLRKELEHLRDRY